ncbi:hypothetical protein [Botrimarina mediterranea]|uniref:hypothetical protein n=1 Tax=Botrimarina mediterranea TaxID=2528022 RepID=UPI001188D5F7|nr:hypothetical protein K2D_16750 [Planctomycetes bacterium K2D]
MSIFGDTFDLGESVDLFDVGEGNLFDAISGPPELLTDATLTVNGMTVAPTWSNSPTAVQYQLEVETPSGQFMPVFGATDPYRTFAEQLLPAGTYRLAYRASNAEGTSDTSHSNEVTYAPPTAPTRTRIRPTRFAPTFAA